MLWDGDIPRHREDGVEVTVIAGELAGLVPPPPPPHSWASRPEADVAIWHIVLQPGARWTVPKARGDHTVRTLYAFDGGGLDIAGTAVDRRTAAVVQADLDLEISSAEGAEVLLLQGRPIAEPVARYGPFVMNTEAEIEQAFADYRETQFGGWPWPTEEPVHTQARGRFAKRPDGAVEEPALS
jgi:redox-sensitive bicupin YhaK (pirin superfamily)